jgi:NNP family nitrate/nitrite transporter-like MFS transporter
MIPVIFLTERQRAARADKASQEQAVKDANKEAAAVLGFSSAIGAYGGFFIPKSYGTSIAMTGSPDGALYAFIFFYLTCIAATWWWYSRKNAPMPC